MAAEHHAAAPPAPWRSPQPQHFATHQRGPGRAARRAAVRFPEGGPSWPTSSPPSEADAATLERLVGAMELRAAQPKQRAMLASYLAELHLPPAARILEVGCGSGAIARFLAARPGVAEVIGVDPSPFFIARAHELALDAPRTADAVAQADLRFEVADGRSLGLGDQTFDAVVIHTVLTHVPGPELMLAEADRRRACLRAQGRGAPAL